jgi:death-on-curing protein
MNVDFLTVEDLEILGRALLGEAFVVLDWGAIQSAAGRPQAIAFGEDAYPSIHDKAAALLHSLVRNHPLQDGNKRLCWAAVVLFYAMNGLHVPQEADAQFDFVMGIAEGGINRVEDIAKQLALWATPLR